MPFPDPAAEPQQQQPIPPQTGADYTVERPSFARRFVDRVGGGTLSGMIAGGVRVGIMGYVLGLTIGSFGLLISGGLTSAAVVGLLTGALPLALTAAAAGAIFVGGAKFVMGLFGTVKDALTSPNKGAEISQTPEQAKGQDQGQGHVQGESIDQVLKRQQGPVVETPGLTSDAITTTNPNAPPPSLYAPTPEQRTERRAQRERDRQELEQLRTWRDSQTQGGTQSNPPQQAPQPANQPPAQNQEWENRQRIGFQQQNQQANASQSWVEKTGSAPSAPQQENSQWADYVAGKAANGPDVTGQSR